MKTQLAISKCGDYNLDNLDKSMSDFFQLLGGVEKFVKPGETVLLKPNLLSAREPEEAVVTHPEFIRSVIRQIKPISKNIKIGDSPGGFGKNIDEICDKAGIRKIADEEGVEIVAFKESRMKGRYPVALPVLDADKVISLPKFKTHDVLLITAAVKNMYGVIPGLFKARQHSIAPRGKEMASIIVDVFSLRKPELTIVDAIQSMDREGPSGGRVRNSNFIIGSTDAVAVDSILMKIIGRNPLDLYTNKEAFKRKLGKTDINAIDILGDSIDSVKMHDFEFSRNSFLERIPDSLFWLFKYVINFRISVDHNKCVRCKLCQDACPASAISIGDRKYNVDHHKCVLCLCCREICPHGAIIINRSWVAKKIWG